MVFIGGLFGAQGFGGRGLQKSAKIEAADKGSYVLLIRLDHGFEVTLGGEVLKLERGDYAYCGSARGPGGLAARIARHRRADKKVHWHVDQVTGRARVVEVGVSTSLSECDLVARLQAQPGTSVPIPGFGSSDCRVCKSHFVKLPDRKVFENLHLQALGS